MSCFLLGQCLIYSYFGTNRDDILGHAKIRAGLNGIMGVATGEHAHNRMTFKQLLQAEAIDVCQIDSVSSLGRIRYKRLIT